MRAEEEARRIEEQRRREDEARLSAIQQGELEKARADAEHRARMEALAQQQAHETNLASLTHDKSKKKLQVIVGVVSGSLLLLAVGGGILWKRSADQKEAEKAALAAQARSAQEELDRLKREFDEKEKKVAELKSQMASAKDDADRAKIEAQLAKAKKDSEDARQRLGGGGGPRGDKPSGPAKPCNCPPGDPLCSCL
jgi:colicin import membrane protein